MYHTSRAFESLVLRCGLSHYSTGRGRLPVDSFGLRDIQLLLLSTDRGRRLVGSARTLQLASGPKAPAIKQLLEYLRDHPRQEAPPSPVYLDISLVDGLVITLGGICGVRLHSLYLSKMTLPRGWAWILCEAAMSLELLRLCDIMYEDPQMFDREFHLPQMPRLNIVIFENHSGHSGDSLEAAILFAGCVTECKLSGYSEQEVRHMLQGTYGTCTELDLDVYLDGIATLAPDLEVLTLRCSPPFSLLMPCTLERLGFNMVSSNDDLEWATWFADASQLPSLKTVEVLDFPGNEYAEEDIDRIERLMGVLRSRGVKFVNKADELIDQTMLDELSW